MLWTHTLVLDAPRVVDRRVVIPLHDALLEDLLNNAQARMGGARPAPQAYSPVVRALRAAFKQAIKRPSVTHQPAVSADAAVGVLAALAVLHGIWGAGETWPARDAERLAEVVGGRSPMPGPGPCWAVAGLLGLAAVTLHSANRPTSRAAVMPYPVADAGVGVLGAVLAVRAAGIVGSFGPSSMSQSFRMMNAAMYSPLCAGLAAACFARRR